MNFVSAVARAWRLPPALAAVLTFAAPADATTLTADEAVDAECSTGDRSGEAGVATETVSVPGVSTVSATLSGAEGNWDLAVIDADSGASSPRRRTRAATRSPRASRPARAT